MENKTMLFYQMESNSRQSPDSKYGLLASHIEEDHSNANTEKSKSSSTLDKNETNAESYVSKSPCHEVTCTVSIALAIHKGEEDDPAITMQKNNKKQRFLSSGVIEAPRSQGYYHIEYNLLPNDPEPTKADLVLFGPAAKIYMENETKVLKPWQEEDQMWIGWSQSVKLKVTRDLLIKMASHKVTFRVWDTKDRVSVKARSDRPKAFRLSQGRSWEDPKYSGGPRDCEAAKSGGIKIMVQNLRTRFLKENPRTTWSSNAQGRSTSADFQNPSKINCVTVKPKQSTVGAGFKEMVSPLAALNASESAALAEEHIHRSISCEAEEDVVLLDLKSTKLKTVLEQTKEPSVLKQMLNKCAQDRSSNALQLCKTAIGPTKSVCATEKSVFLPRRKTVRKAPQESVVLHEHSRKNGVASVELSLIHLLAGDKSVTDCLKPSFPGACEGLASISIDKQLISEELKVELNPLVIRILSASSMPASPVPFHVLKEKCFPVYCQYKFHNMNVHRTKGQSHGANVYFKDVNVILTGLLSPGELHECLAGPPLEIEVHDRDRKSEKLTGNPALFGTEPTDDQLSSKHTAHNTFQDQHRLCNPCGIAKLDFSDLLHGQKCLKVSVPITSSPLLPLVGKDSSRWKEREFGTASTVDGPLEPPIPMGHYHDSNSVVKVRVEIACPLIKESSSTDGDDPGCPFGRIIYMFRDNTSTAPSRLRSEILRINAAAFQLESAAEETVKTALSCYKMNAKERESKDLDVVTGFHVHDGHIHLFVLEGLKDEAIRRLWETIPIQLSGGEEEQVEILYNSALSFSKRLYGTLDLSLRPIHLHKQLERIMQQPVIYVRDTVPSACLQALSRLSLLLHVKKLKDVVQSSLFPSAEMVLSLSREFGTIPSKIEKEMTHVQPEAHAAAGMSPQHASAKTILPLDNHNVKYMEWKQHIANEQLHGKTKDFIQGNIEEVHQASLNIQRAKPPIMVAFSELSQELLRKEMAKEHVWRFCRSQEYQLALQEVAHHETERKTSVGRSKAAWRTYDGFRFPGFKSSIESNEHPHHPDEARVEELRKPWRENILHGNILRPTLTRDTWPWVARLQDFERYAKPPRFFGAEPPVTIHLAGERLKQEQLQAIGAQYHQKALSDAGSPGTQPLPEFKCQMRMAQGDLDKFQDLLKDMPMKYSLRKPGMVLKPIPVVSVIHHPEVTGTGDSEEEVSPAFAPGPLEHHSLSWDSNAIPRHDNQYNKFHFTGYWRPHSFQYKRAALPLTEEERSVQLFQQPATPPKAPASVAQIQPSGNIVETRTYNNIYLHVV